MSSRHVHTGLSRKIRHSVRFDRKPKAPSDRFTYRQVEKDGETGMAVFNEGQPLFGSKAIKCSRDEALSLVRKLNRVPPWLLETKGEEIVQEWFKSISSETTETPAEEAKG